MYTIKENEKGQLVAVAPDGDESIIHNSHGNTMASLKDDIMTI